LAELLGHITANLNASSRILFSRNTKRVEALLDKYFQPKYQKSNKYLETYVDGKMLDFLKHTAQFSSCGFPMVVNTFNREQTIAFFKALYLNLGSSTRNTNTSIIRFRGKNKRFLEYCQLHLNKLGLSGSLEMVKNKPCLSFYCGGNYKQFEVLFPDIPLPFFTCRDTFCLHIVEETGEDLKYGRVISITDVGLGEVWDVEYEEKGWFIAGGIKVHNSGKTQTVAMIIASCMILLPEVAKVFEELAPLFEKGFWVGIFAPVMEQASTLFDRVHNIFSTDTCKEMLTGELRMPIPAKGGARGNVMVLANGSVCRMHSANVRSRVESKTYHLIVFDEAQDIPEKKASLSIKPMGAAVNATTIVTGTPGYVAGLFYNMIEMNKKDDVKKNELEQSHFEADYTIAQKYNKYYKKYIEKEKKTLGETSEEFRAAYLLIWPISRGMMFTKDLLTLKCYNNQLKTVSSYKESPCIAGVDFGKHQFSTVLTIIKPLWEDTDEEGNMPKIILDWLELEGDEWEAQYPQLVEKLENYWIDTLVCDATGVGDPITERLSMMLPEVTVTPFVFSSPNVDRGYKYLLKEVVGERIIIPHSASVVKKSTFKRFELQTLSLTKHYNGRFLMPRSINVDKISEDYVDSLMMAVYGTFYENMPEIEIGFNPFFENDRKNRDIFGYKFSRGRG
jgi:hypothetical protein